MCSRTLLFCSLDKASYFCAHGFSRHPARERTEHPHSMPLLLVLQGGDLRNALSRELHEGTHDFDWYNKGKDVALAVARGLNFLHNNNVVHRCCLPISSCYASHYRGCYALLD